MRIIAQSTLTACAERHPTARASLFRIASLLKAASWAMPAEACRAIPGTDTIGKDRLVINVGGNEWRLIVAVDYARQVIYIKWFGSHAEYDRVDAATIEHSG